jgi:hypothetical protein
MEDAGKRPEQRGLAETRHALEQHVTTGKETNQNAIDDVLLTDYDLGNFTAHEIETLDRHLRTKLWRHLSILFGSGFAWEKIRSGVAGNGTAARKGSGEVLNDENHFPESLPGRAGRDGRGEAAPHPKQAVV